MKRPARLPLAPRSIAAGLVLWACAWSAAGAGPIGPSARDPRLVSPHARAAFASAPQTDGEAPRELAGIREEQALLRRQLQRLRQTMQLLESRLSAEGRSRTVELLRGALAQLDQREAQAQSLEEWMASSELALDAGQVLVALEQQDRAIAELQALLDVLLDRTEREDVEEQLATLAERREQIQQLAREEREVKDAIQRLREEARTPEQRAAATRLAELAAKQAAVLEATLEASRAGRDFEYEALARELERLRRDQATDREVLAR